MGNNRFIDIKDSLPNIEGYYEVIELERWGTIEAYYKDGKFYSSKEFNHHLYSVTHWRMGISNPYKHSFSKNYDIRM